MGGILSLFCAVLPFLCGPPPTPAPTLPPTAAPSPGPSHSPTVAPNGGPSTPAEGGILFDAPEVDFMEEVVILSGEMNKIHKGRWRFDAVAPCMGGDPLATPRVRMGHVECTTDGGSFELESLWADSVYSFYGNVAVGPGVTAEWDDPADYDLVALGFDGMKLVCQVSCMADSVGMQSRQEKIEADGQDIFVTRTPACEPGKRLLGITCITTDRGRGDFVPRRLIAQSASVNPNDGVLSVTCGWERPNTLSQNNEIPGYTVISKCTAQDVL